MQLSFKTSLVFLLLVLAFRPEPGFAKTNRQARPNDLFVCGTGVQRERDALLRSRYRDSLLRSRPGRGRLLMQEQARALLPDAGNIALVEDDGTIVSAPNRFDLQGKAILFVPASPTAFQVTVRPETFTAGTGTRVLLSDDDSKSVPLAAAFTFFGQRYSSVNLNSDGNLTFNEPDTASTARDLGRFAWGPPRIGPLFADLDPAGGTVSYRTDPDGTTFVWENVPGFGTAEYNSFSVKLFINGNIEFAYGSRVETPEDVVGISPGALQEGISAFDFSSGLPTGPLAGTIAEVFTPTGQLSETAIARKFFQNHPDEFDQLVVFLSFPYDLQGAFSYELNINNEVRGIGLDLVDNSIDYGSGGHLKSFVMMGDVGQFPPNPNVEFMRTYSSLAVIAHEVAHRWLAFPYLWEERFSTESLLHSTDLSHWSFFFNADASLMEGNQILDRGAGLGSQRFVTSEVTNRLSSLDLYLMGFEDPNNVLPMFYVKNPTGTTRRSDSLPQHAPTVFGGTRWDFTIDDIVTANGPRTPSVFKSQKVHRLGFILVTRPGEAVTEKVSKLQAFHDAFVPYFNQLTKGEAWAVTNLQTALGTTPSRIYFPSFEGDSTRYTGMALANWGSTPADVLFTFFDNAGNEILLPSSILNPRMITIPPGSQIAMLAEQIHGLSPGNPRNGWIRAESSSSLVAGFFLEGDINLTFLDGASAGDQTSTWLCFTRAMGGGGSFRNRIKVINPNATDAHLSFRLMHGDGRQQGAAVERTLSPRGRLSEDSSELFPGTDPNFSGYITLSSDVGVAGYESLAGSSTVCSLPAQPTSAATTLYSAQFASGPAGTTRYFTDLNLINTSAERRHVRVSLTGNDGLPVLGAVPAEFWLDPGEQRLTRGEEYFSLANAAVALQITEGTLVITVNGAGVIGDVTFGDPLAGRFMAGLALDGSPATSMVLSQVAEGGQDDGKSYFTGIAMYNPNPQDVLVTVDLYAEQGQQTGTRTFTLGRGMRLSKTLPQIIPGFSRQMRGYIRITTNGGPIIAFELFGESSSLDFLAAVPPKTIFP
jgi:hypothetical protein